MFNLRKDELVVRAVCIRNPGEGKLTVWLEPWADSFILAPHESLEIVIVGPDTGLPVVLPRHSEVSVYGWAGSEGFAFQNDRLLGRQPTVEEIVAQEFEIHKDAVERTPTQFDPVDIEHCQTKLNSERRFDGESQDLACDIAGILAISLARSLVESDAAAGLLWQIVDRVMGTRGLVLAIPDAPSQGRVFWRDDPAAMDLVRGHAMSIVPFQQDPNAAENVTPRRAGSKSGSA